MASSRRFQGLARRLPGAKSPTLDVERELEHAGATVSEWVATHHPLNQLTDDDIDTDWPDHDARLAKFIEENEENAKAKGWNVRQLLMMFLLVEGRDVTRYGYEVTLEIDQPLFETERGYYVEWDSGAILSAGDNAAHPGISGDNTWRFTCKTHNNGNPIVAVE